MELTLSTPALLFSTVSLLMIAFTTRFLAIANLIRDLHKQFQDNPKSLFVAQIKNLHRRLRLIRTVQALAVLSLILSGISMLVLLEEYHQAAKVLFVSALVLQITSLSLSLFEISISIKALQIELNDMEEALDEKGFGLFPLRSRADAGDEGQSTP